MAIMLPVFRRPTLNPTAAVAAASAPAFDAASSTSSDAGGDTTLTWEHTCGGDNRFLLVAVTAESFGESLEDIVSVTYNGEAMDSAGLTSGNGIEIVLYFLLAPASGAHDIVITFTGDKVAVAGAISVRDVNPSVDNWDGAELDNSGTTLTMELAAPKGAGYLSLGFAGALAAASAAATAGIERIDTAANGFLLWGGTADEDGPIVAVLNASAEYVWTMLTVDVAV